MLAVIVARDLADLGEEDYTLEDLIDEWSATEFDLAKDAVVAETAEGTIVGYACVRSPGSIGIVTPDAEGRGTGARLLAFTQQRERERGRDVHRPWIANSNRTGERLLRNAGYERVRSYYRMAIRLDGPLEPVSLPEGYQLRPLAADDDARALHELDNASFSANPDYNPESFATFRDEHLLAHNLDPQLSRVACHDGGIAGFLLTRNWREESTGFIDILAVHPDHQGRGLGSALLRSAFSACTAAGLEHAKLGVASDNPRARRLYEREGMQPLFQFDTYERAMDR